MGTRAGHSLFPLEAPSERQRAGGLELDDRVWVVQLQSLVLAGRARGGSGREERLGQGVCD